LSKLFGQGRSFGKDQPVGQESSAYRGLPDTDHRVMNGGRYSNEKLINSTEDVVDEMLDGMLSAYPYHLKRAPNTKRTVMLADAPVKGKVGIIKGGGSGHLPLFLGYTGKGLLDGTAVGDVFSSPSSNEIFELTKAVHGGAGVLYLYGNYGGDILNFDMAADMAEDEDIETATSIGSDDVASARMTWHRLLPRRRTNGGALRVYSTPTR
jgi:dihydroxyacetone kinase